MMSVAMIYVIDKENAVHIVEYYGRSHRYFTKCGTIINKTDRVHTLNFDDITSLICPKCLNYSEFANKETRYDTSHDHGNVGARQTESMIWHEKGFNFLNPEYKYGDEIDRDSAFMRKMLRYTSRKHRKSHVN